MSYNKYTPRNAQRYNTPGTFVPAGSFTGGTSGGYGIIEPLRQPDSVQTFNKPISHNSNSNFSVPQNLPQPHQPIQPPISMEQESMETTPSDVSDVTNADGSTKPFWMKSKLVGVKKISNRERRRRQNENLRRLLTPKNALMVLNEIMSGEQLANQFKVCPVTGGGGSGGGGGANYYKPAQGSFCAELSVNGRSYIGYGETKMLARNNAAEQAIRDLMIKRMSKLFGDDADDGGAAAGAGAGAGGEGAGGGGEGEEGEAGEGDTLPMIQLASYALHKLFTDWECEGHKVPQLKPHTTSETSTEAPASAPAPPASDAPPAKKPKAPRVLPPHAAAMHPCMLLTYMRPQLEYRELAAQGDTPQTMLFTMAVEVDGVTYVGKAGNKKEARKAAAKAACEEIFKVQFEF